MVLYRIIASNEETVSELHGISTLLEWCRVNEITALVQVTSHDSFTIKINDHPILPGYSDPVEEADGTIVYHKLDKPA